MLPYLSNYLSTQTLEIITGIYLMIGGIKLGAGKRGK